MPNIPTFPQKPNAGVEVNDKLAINMFDVDLIDVELKRNTKLLSKLDLTTPVWVDRNKSDEYCLVFNCSVLHAAILLDIVRSRDRETNQNVTRVYLCKKVWQKLPSDCILTIVDEVGKVKLNRDIFTIKLPLANFIPDLRSYKK